VLIAFSPVVSGKTDEAGNSLSMIRDASIDFAWFPLENPGIVTIPLGFLLGVVGTLTSREKGVKAKFAEMEVRSLTGAGSEKAATEH
jgi:cation/acetate symporter